MHIEVCENNYAIHRSYATADFNTTQFNICLYEIKCLNINEPKQNNFLNFLSLFWYTIHLNIINVKI